MDNASTQGYQQQAAAQGGCGQVLERLEAIVEERRQTMPEGSYTTHLFASGPEKIRKKAGEEAVELILASSREQIVFEAADVLYHMCVLLVSEGISYGEVCGELQKRHATG
jgi:phosphoribosyl-ATP pyrophosphohydrolase